jgi:nucleoid DNA-binding protein
MTDTPGLKQSRLETNALVRQVAERCFIPDDTVKAILDSFVDVMREALQREERIIIRNFGVLYTKQAGYGPFKGTSIKFKASLEFKKGLKKEGEVKPMEKYGVELKDEATLMAKVTGECPACKSKLDSTEPPKCPNCGTKPFERQSSMNANFAILYGKEKDDGSEEGT